MASSSTFAVILVFVALGGVLAAEAAGRPSGTLQGWNGMGNNGNGNGNDDVERMILPDIALASPLDAEKTAKYLAQINDNTLGGHSTEFCQEAKLQCNADIAIVDPTLRISRSSLADQELFQQTRDLVEATRAMQFDRKNLDKDNEIALPEHLQDSIPAVSFLPKSLADKMPFTSAKMPELFEKLSIPHDSNLAIMMSRTVGQCEAQEQGKEIRKCVNSMEDMKTFVSSNLPEDKRIVALERSSTLPGAGESRSKDTWKVVEAKLYNHAVVCRNAVFPYAVYECHDTSNTGMHIYQVNMMGSGDHNHGANIHQVAACSHETNSAAAMTESSSSSSSSSAPAQLCHWLTDSLIWAASAN